MKRVLTITLTVALLGSLMLMGFAGSAAAQNVDINIGTGDTGDVDQDAEQNAEINQQNNNAQVGIADATAVGADGAHDKKHKSGGSNGGAAAAASVDQVQVVGQENDAEIEQEIEQEGESGDSEINVEILLDFLGNNLPA
ncbi:hypothetical protein [Natronococcus wangiae]|uniref:hypothetical protein n=1 Tax=Natronococcus wangiae TaxID=3068275 RepID=UPI00273F6446|nr:hypothetical protein [Natronococcus sp. AD5]